MTMGWQSMKVASINAFPSFILFIISLVYPFLFLF